MIKLHTHTEQLEHLQQDLWLFDRHLKHSVIKVKEIGDILPAGLLINDQYGKNYYMNKRSEEKLHYCREELDSLGKDYVKKILPEPDHRNYLLKQLEQFYKRKDFSEIFCLYQKVTPKNKKSKWMLTNSKLWQDDKKDNLHKRVVVAVSVDEMGVCARRIGKVLDDNIYMRKYFKRFASLTKREKEIVALVALGNNNPQIAEQLYISRNTVEQHRKNINRKLEFKTFRELIIFAEVFELI